MKHSEALIKVNELRSKGYSYTQVARELGFTKQRVGQILHKQVRIESDKTHWAHGLSVRNRHILDKLQISSREVAIHAVNVGDIRPFKWPNFGIRSYNDLCKWLGVTPPCGKYSRSAPKLVCCPRCATEFSIQ